MDFGFQESNETMSFICSIPFVKRLIRENKKLKKKNRELKQLVKLITKNFDLFQDDESDTPIEIIGAPIKLEKNDLEFEDLDDEVLIVDPPTNIHCDIHEVESDDTEVVNPYPEDQMETTKTVNKKNYDDDSCSFNSILGAVKTVEDYNKLTIFYKKLWIKNNSLDSLEKNATKCAECYNVVTNRLRHHGLCTICFSNRDCEAKISKSKDEVVEEEDEEEEVVEEEEEEVVEDEEEEVVEEDEEEEEEEVVEEEEEEVVEEEEEEVVEEEEEEVVVEEEEEEEVEVVVEEDEEEVVVEEDEEEEEEEVVVEEDEEDEEDVYEIVINKKTYYTTDMKNGIIYDTDENGEISVEVGKLVNGVHKLNKKKK